MIVYSIQHVRNIEPNNPVSRDIIKASQTIAGEKPSYHHAWRALDGRQKAGK